ncbi:anthrone oxygenase family protein [Streptomyces longisporoflavus]|uniref:anthrone oxygenase family protein n=1 Tax=Streptomyces longisporoflavus TaxID=28044 RepID=UPI001E5B83F1|nr:anthrone oxygenase family protein [Streptomyces longisporoflavus]
MRDNRVTNRRRRGGAGAVLGAAVVAMGLIAGTFYIFSCGVMPGLGRSDDRVFIEVMQNMNDAFNNPVFFASFIGALLFTAVSAWQLRGTTSFRWVLAALIAYLLAFAITSGVNVPLNDELADAGDPAKISDPAAVRERFEDVWLAWNAVRTVLSTVAVGLLARALVLWGRAGRDDQTRQSAYLDPAADPAAGSSASR